MEPSRGLEFVTAIARTCAVIAAIGDGQLTIPTVSSGCTVGDLLEYVDGVSWGLPLTGGSTFPADVSAPHHGDRRVLAAGWRERIPDQLTRVVRLWAEITPAPNTSGAGNGILVCASPGTLALIGVIVHGWDLARSTGQAYEIDSTVGNSYIDFLTRRVPNELSIAPPVPVPSNATPITRLVALTGRDPHWCPLQETVTVDASADRAESPAPAPTVTPKRSGVSVTF